MIFFDENQNGMADFVSQRSKEFIESMLQDCSNPYVIYCFNDSVSCQAILDQFLSGKYGVRIKTTKEILEKLSSEIDNAIILDIGIVPFHLFVFDKDVGYFVLYRNKFFGSYFDNVEGSKELIASIVDKVEKISKLDGA